MNEDKGEVGVTIVVRRFGIDREIEGPAAGWVRFSTGSAMEDEQAGQACEECEPVWRARAGRPADRCGDLLIRHRNFLRSGLPAFTGAGPFANADIVGR